MRPASSRSLSLRQGQGCVSHPSLHAVGVGVQIGSQHNGIARDQISVWPRRPRTLKNFQGLCIEPERFTPRQGGIQAPR